MKILVTGGAGFIGRHLVKRLLKDGHEVIVLDNLFRWPKSVMSNLKVKFFEGSVSNESLVKELIKDVDIVFHLAAVSQVMTAIEKTDLCFEYNILGTYLVAKYCSLFGKKLIFSSSREVYGDAIYLPVDLQHPLNPKNNYASSKICGESIIRSTNNLNYVILRISNVIGSGDKDRVVPLFIKLARTNEDIEVFGHEKIIDFIYISDVVDALIKSLGVSKVILNLGSGCGSNLKDVADLVVSLLFSKSVFSVTSNRDNEVDKFYSDISLTKELLDWAPKYDINNALRSILNESA
ncbi:MAG: SDR family NAD(P)-dependent oxidoreductase [Candidatus Nanoarchaeia archaeon]|jgi:UDP-glucose 4-epimerase